MAGDRALALRVSRRGRPPVLSPDERRRHILGAVDELFGEGGIEGLTIAAIAVRAGMSRRTLYEMFADRETLLLAYLDDLVSRCLQPLAPAEQALPLAERLRLLFEEPHEWGPWDLPLEILRLAIDNARAAPNIGLRCLEIGARRVEALVRDELDRAVARAEMPPTDTATAAAILCDMAHVPVLQALLDSSYRPDAAARQQRTAMALHLFLRGIAASPPGSRAA